MLLASSEVPDAAWGASHLTFTEAQLTPRSSHGCCGAPRKNWARFLAATQTVIFRLDMCSLTGKSSAAIRFSASSQRCVAAPSPSAYTVSAVNSMPAALDKAAFACGPGTGQSLLGEALGHSDLESFLRNPRAKADSFHSKLWA